MNTIVRDVPTVETALVVQVALELAIDVVQDGLVAIRCVDPVAVARGVHHGEAYFDAALFDFHCGCFDLHSLTDFLYRRSMNSRMSARSSREREKYPEQ